MNTIEMSRKDFTKKVLKKIENRLITEGFVINEDVDDEGYAGGDTKAWEKYVREALAMSKGESTYTKTKAIQIYYTSIEGKSCSIEVRESSEYYNKLKFVTRKQYEKGIVSPEVWNEMVTLVREMIEKSKRDKPKMYQLDRIYPKDSHDGGRTASTLRVNWVDIDSFNIVGFDNFYDGICRNIIEYPKEKCRCRYAEPISFVETTGGTKTTYNADIHVEWNFEPFTYTIYGKFVLKDVYDVEEGPDFKFDMDLNTIPKISHPVDESIKRNLSDERPKIEDRLFAESVRNKSIWFDVYINVMDHVKTHLSKHRITDVKPLSDISAQEIINHVNSETVE